MCPLLTDISVIKGVGREELAESIMKFQSLEISIPWPSDLDGDFQGLSF
jgi:hypothetical protein